MVKVDAWKMAMYLPFLYVGMKLERCDWFDLWCWGHWEMSRVAFLFVNTNNRMTSEGLKWRMTAFVKGDRRIYLKKCGRGGRCIFGRSGMVWYGRMSCARCSVKRTIGFIAVKKQSGITNERLVCIRRFERFLAYESVRIACGSHTVHWTVCMMWCEIGR